MNSLQENNDNLLLNFPSFLRKNMEDLILRGKISLVPLTFIDIHPLLNCKFEADAQMYSYRYFVKIPYAGRRLSWELIFNPENIGMTPDFDFKEHNFLNGPDIEYILENIPSLAKWDINNPKSLRCVLEEFMQIYKKFQLNKLRSENIFSHINTEYEQLITSIEPKDIEVWVDNSTVHLLIKININTSELPEAVRNVDGNINDEAMSSESCILKVNYHKSDGSRVTTSLQLSPKLEQICGKLIKISIYTKSTKLEEYVMKISETVNDLLVDNQRGQGNFLNYLCTEWSDSLIEWNQVNSIATFLCEVDNYLSLVCIEVGPKFPLDKPKVTLKSICCMIPQQLPCIEVLEDYPFSPRWTHKMIIKKMNEHIINAIVKYKMHKH